MDEQDGQDRDFILGILDIHVRSLRAMPRSERAVHAPDLMANEASCYNVITAEKGEAYGKTDP